MVIVDKLDEYVNLNVLKTYCNNKTSFDSCDGCVISNLCDCLSEAPGSMEIRYSPNLNEEMNEERGG